MHSHLAHTWTKRNDLLVDLTPPNLWLQSTKHATRKSVTHFKSSSNKPLQNSTKYESDQGASQNLRFIFCWLLQWCFCCTFNIWCLLSCRTTETRFIVCWGLQCMYQYSKQHQWKISNLQPEAQCKSQQNKNRSCVEAPRSDSYFADFSNVFIEHIGKFSKFCRIFQATCFAMFFALWFQQAGHQTPWAAWSRPEPPGATTGATRSRLGPPRAAWGRPELLR